MMKRAVNDLAYTVIVWVGLVSIGLTAMYYAGKYERVRQAYEWLRAPVIEADPLPYKVEAVVYTSQLDKAELQCAAATIWWEARGENILGQLAIFAVMTNRIKDRSGQWGDTYCEVAQEADQFTGVQVHGLYPSKKDRVQFAIIKGRVADWMAFGFVNPVGDATNYHATWMDKYPRWSQELTKVGIIGQHIFYM